MTLSFLFALPSIPLDYFPLGPLGFSTTAIIYTHTLWPVGVWDVTWGVSRACMQPSWSLYPRCPLLVRGALLHHSLHVGLPQRIQDEPLLPHQGKKTYNTDPVFICEFFGSNLDSVAYVGFICFWQCSLQQKLWLVQCFFFFIFYILSLVLLGFWSFKVIL